MVSCFLSATTARAGYGVCGTDVNGDSFMDVVATSNGGSGSVFIFFLNGALQVEKDHEGTVVPRFIAPDCVTPVL